MHKCKAKQQQLSANTFADWVGAVLKPILRAVRSACSVDIVLPHVFVCIVQGLWRNGSASDSRSVDWAFESRGLSMTLQNAKKRKPRNTSDTDIFYHCAKRWYCQLSLAVEHPLSKWEIVGSIPAAGFCLWSVNVDLSMLSD